MKLREVQDDLIAMQTVPQIGSGEAALEVALWLLKRERFIRHILAAMSKSRALSDDFVSTFNRWLELNPSPLD